VDELRRARSRHVEVELTDLHHPRVTDSSLALADRDALEHAFGRLDPVQRSLIVMYYYLDLPLAEVAEALSLPMGTAKSRLFRARETLRAALEADARDGVEIVGGQPA
jgi:RNA polymerase sigma factor (sigma-70 family)